MPTHTQAGGGGTDDALPPTPPLPPPPPPQQQRQLPSAAQGPPSEVAEARRAGQQPPQPPSTLRGLGESADVLARRVARFGADGFGATPQKRQVTWTDHRGVDGALGGKRARGGGDLEVVLPPTPALPPDPRLTPIAPAGDALGAMQQAVASHAIADTHMAAVWPGPPRSGGRAPLTLEASAARPRRWNVWRRQRAEATAAARARGTHTRFGSDDAGGDGAGGSDSEAGDGCPPLRAPSDDDSEAGDDDPSDDDLHDPSRSAR